MPRYNEEFKEKIVQKMMPPNSISVTQVHYDTGVSRLTLYNWKKRFQNKGKAVPADPSNPENWDGKHKLAVVVETASLNQQELSEYCRKKGLYVEQITRWEELALGGFGCQERLTKAERSKWKKEKKEALQVKKELLRKEKALAETAALLVLKKKPRNFGGSQRTNDST